jgi:hypothetical protein
MGDGRYIRKVKICLQQGFTGNRVREGRGREGDERNRELMRARLRKGQGDKDGVRQRFSSTGKCPFTRGREDAH